METGWIHCFLWLWAIFLPFVYKTALSAKFSKIWMLMWSWGKTAKEWNSNAYYHQVNISESPQSTLNNYIVSNGNIFPDLAQVTNHDFQESRSRQQWSCGWVFSPVMDHQCFLTWQEPHHICQWPGNPKPPGWNPGEGAQSYWPAHILKFFSSWPSKIMGF
jgi:hypothetical protein